MVLVILSISWWLSIPLFLLQIILRGIQCLRRRLIPVVNGEKRCGRGFLLMTSLFIMGLWIPKGLAFCKSVCQSVCQSVGPSVCHERGIQSLFTAVIVAFIMVALAAFQVALTGLYFSMIFPCLGWDHSPIAPPLPAESISIARYHLITLDWMDGIAIGCISSINHRRQRERTQRVICAITDNLAGIQNLAELVAEYDVLA